MNYEQRTEQSFNEVNVYRTTTMQIVDTEDVFFIISPHSLSGTVALWIVVSCDIVVFHNNCETSFLSSSLVLL